MAYGSRRAAVAARLEGDWKNVYRASCTLLRKRWISRSIRDDQPSPSPRRASRFDLDRLTSAAAFAATHD